MRCRLDECQQGHCACPAPEVCSRPFSVMRYLRGYASVFIRWRDHAAAKRAGHLAAITPSEPIDWELALIYIAAGIAFGVCLLLSIH